MNLDVSQKQVLSPVDADLKSRFSSLFGGMDCVVQTRPNIAVFTAALKAQAAVCYWSRQNQFEPSACVCKEETVRKPMKLAYHQVRSPWQQFQGR